MPQPKLQQEEDVLPSNIFLVFPSSSYQLKIQAPSAHKVERALIRSYPTTGKVAGFDAFSIYFFCFLRDAKSTLQPTIDVIVMLDYRFAWNADRIDGLEEEVI